MISNASVSAKRTSTFEFAGYVVEIPLTTIVTSSTQ
jgi:hypothetical protein